jgi:hypothetical protein
MTWINQSLDGTAWPLAPRISIVASPTPAEANSANHKARRKPRQGVRASARSLARS